MRNYFMKTERIGFSTWSENDIDLANQLWGDKNVTEFICATGKFTEEDIENRLDTEIMNDKKYSVQYWPIFSLKTNELVGCCGLRPFSVEENSYEIGFHICKEYWGQGYATEAANAVIKYAFYKLKISKIFAGHNPKNVASKNLLSKLRFEYIGNNFYEPTGLFHPSYELSNAKLY